MSGDTLIVTLTVSQLSELIKETVQQTVKDLLPKSEPRYYSGKEVAKILSVTPQTIVRYEQKGILIGKRYGHIKRYEESDVQAALKTIKKYKIG